MVFIGMSFGALVAVAFFFLALAAAGRVVYGSSLPASALAALSGATGLHFGYLLRLFSFRKPGGGRALRPPVRSEPNSTEDGKQPPFWRSGPGCPAVGFAL